MFKGSLTALVTPMKDGAVDEAALRGLVKFQIDGGTDGLVPCGTTGESATLSHDEHNRVIDIVIEEAAGRVPVIAGTGSNSTEETVKLTAHAKEAGADAALLITPYYNKPSQQGLIEHYRSVADSVELPLILYNVPGRTALNMLPETVATLASHKNIVGIKEATADLEQISEVIAASGSDFAVLSGDDATTLPLLSVGGVGVISVVANLVPGDMSDLCSLYMSGKIDEARALHYKLLPLSAAMFIDTNPVPVKTALAMMGLATEALRLPLVALSDADRKTVKAALEAYGLI